jgi:transcriptional regulator with XRE-family HTH domain
MDRREEVLRKFGQRLTHLREKQNFTVAELALRSGLDPGLIGEIEAGRVDPEISMIVALAGGLGVTLGELVDAF